jgi:adenylate cyclase
LIGSGVARLSPRDPSLFVFYLQKGAALQIFGREAEALDWVNRSLSVNPKFPITQLLQISILGILGSDGEAHEAYQRYNAWPERQFRTIADYKAFYSSIWKDPVSAAALQRRYDALRKSGMSED